MGTAPGAGTGFEVADPEAGGGWSTRVARGSVEDAAAVGGDPGEGVIGGDDLPRRPPSAHVEGFFADLADPEGDCAAVFGGGEEGGFFSGAEMAAVGFQREDVSVRGA